MSGQELDMAWVNTPGQLKDAIQDDRRNIIITAHLDMTTLPLRQNEICPSGCASPLPEIREADSIRGNCSAPPTAADLAVLANTPGAVALLPFQPGQCLLMTTEDMLPALTRHLWLDNVYIRMVYHNAPDPRPFQYASLAAFPPLRGKPYRWHGQHYVTRCTFQGDGLGPAVGIWADENGYIENCTFANLGGEGVGFAEEPCYDCSAALNVHNVSVTVVNSTFFEPVPLAGSAYIRAWNNARVLLSGCVFAPTPELQLSPFYVGLESAIFSDDPPAARVRTTEGYETAILPTSALPDVPPDDNTVMLQRSDPWFVNILKELDQVVPPRPAYPAPTAPQPLLDASAYGSAAPAASGGGGGGAPIAAIAGSGGAVLLLIVLAACYVLWRRRRSRGGGTAGGVGVPKDIDVTGGQTTDATSWSNSNYIRQWPQGPGKGGAMGARAGSGGAFPAAGPVGSTPQHGQEVASLLALIHSQLDSIGPNDVLQQQFNLLGPSHRRQGGQSVVASAAGAYSPQPFIMKFYAVRAAFDAEMAIRNDRALAELAPKIQSAHDPLLPEEENMAICDRAGRPMAPCIVMPRGEGLVDWLQRATPDVFQAVSVLSHIAQLVRDIHAAAYVHGNVKPAHVIHIRLENRWSLTDFDRAARIATAVPPVYTLPYSAPELVIAAGRGNAFIAAHPAMDCWSLGVVAFELFTGKPAFDPASDRAADVEAQMRGEAPLPWEGSRLDAEARRRLGIFCEPVLALLQRAPEARISARAFCDACHDIVASNTTTAGPDSLMAPVPSAKRL